MNSFRILKSATLAYSKTPRLSMLPKPPAHLAKTATTAAAIPRTRLYQTDAKTAPAPSKPVWESKLVYEGVLTKAAKVMKLASVASLVGATAAVPLFFAGDSDVPSSARTILAVTTLGMTASSTALVTWALKPYITSLHVMHRPGHPVEDSRIPMVIETMTFLAQPRTRLVFPEQLVPATLPMTSWLVEDASESLRDFAKDIIDQINAGRKKDLVTLASKGDLFYAHTQGPVSAEMQRILQAAPSQ